MINKVQLIGHVGQDPEIKVLENGKKLAKFSLATNEHHINALGERVETTNWHHIIFWNRNAEIVEQYVSKGSRLAIEGRLSTRSWEDDNGNKHFWTEVVGKQLLMFRKTP